MRRGVLPRVQVLHVRSQRPAELNIEWECAMLLLLTLAFFTSRLQVGILLRAFSQPVKNHPCQDDRLPRWLDIE